MTNRIWPADAINGAPAYSGRALRQTQAPFLTGATSTRPLGARSGVRPGTSTATVTATATAWTCRAHAGVLDVMTAAESGPYTYAVDAAVSGTVDPSNASNPRTDIVYVQLSDAAEEGTPGQPPAVTVGYKAGVAGPTAVVPSPPVRSIVLAQINVPKTGGGNPTVTWVAPYASSAGGVVTFATREALDAAVVAVGTLGLVAPTGQIFEYVGGSAPWLHAAGAPEVCPITFSSGTYLQRPAEQPFRIERQGGRCYFVGTATSTDGTGSVTFNGNQTYPLGTIGDASFRPKEQVSALVRFGTGYAVLVVATSGAILFSVPATVTYSNGSLVFAPGGINWTDRRL